MVATGIGFTVMTMGSEVAVAGATQSSADGVITTVTASRFFNWEVVKVAPVWPVTSTPLVFH